MANVSSKVSSIASILTRDNIVLSVVVSGVVATCCVLRSSIEVVEPKIRAFSGSIF